MFTCSYVKQFILDMNAQDFQLGLKNSKIVHVTEVESGLKCNCYCPCCGGKFVAYKGKVLRPHFKHQVESSCNYSFETSLHYLAKEIIQKKKYLDLPVVNWIIPNTPSSWFSRDSSENSLPPFEAIEFQRIYFDKVEVEKWEGNFIPDLKCFVGNKQLLMEITVTHGINDKKLEKIKSHDLPLIEINLSLLEHTISRKTLAKALYNKKGNSNERISNFKWIHNPKNNQLFFEKQQKSNQILEFLKDNRKYIKLYGRNKEIYNCPVREKNEAPYKYSETCKYCPYYLGKTEPLKKSDEVLGIATHREIMCIGHKQYELEKLFNDCGVKGVV